MAKFYGQIGFFKQIEREPGLWVDEIIEKSYFGDVLRKSFHYQQSEGVNDNINISNRISILADPFAHENIPYIKYIEYMGVKWKVTDVEVEHPRLILTIGGIYNE